MAGDAGTRGRGEGVTVADQLADAAAADDGALAAKTAGLAVGCAALFAAARMGVNARGETGGALAVVSGLAGGLLACLTCAGTGAGTAGWPGAA